MSSKVFINHLDYYIPEGRMLIEDFVNTISEEGVSVFQSRDKFKEYLEEFLPLEHLAIEKESSLETILINLLKYQMILVYKVLIYITIITINQ